jgi:hypothetical protein
MRLSKLGALIDPLDVVFNGAQHDSHGRRYHCDRTNS